MSSLKIDFCPECGIGLNNREIHMCFCQNCKTTWDEDGNVDSGNPELLKGGGDD